MPGEGARVLEGCTRILGMVGRLCGDDPCFLRLLIQLCSYSMSQLDLIDPLVLQKKISLFLSHLVPEMLGPKFGQMFHQKVLFNSF